LRETAGAYFIQKGGKSKEEIRSEQTKDLTPDELAALQQEVAGMTPEELRQFRNLMDADSMGFFGKESL